jgi:hypothetical protein
MVLAKLPFFLKKKKTLTELGAQVGFYCKDKKKIIKINSKLKNKKIKKTIPSN